MRPYTGRYRPRADGRDADIAAPAFFNQGLCQGVGSVFGDGIGAVFCLGTVGCILRN